MLEMRTNCECCDRNLPPGSGQARICSFERTYCAKCAEKDLGGKCPGCKGELMERPRRAAKYLAQYPPTTKGSSDSGEKKTRPKRVLTKVSV